MYYNHNLRVNLKEWRNRLYKASSSTFDNAHKFFFDKLKQTPALNTYLITSQFIPKEGAFDEVDFSYGSPDFSFLSEEDEAVFKFYFIEYLLAKPNSTIMGWLPSLVGGHTYSENISNYVEEFIDPIVNFLADQLDESSSMLYLIERYKLRSEWFFKEQLTKAYRGKSSGGEAVLDKDLRLFLFDQGVEYPFSTPHSASGRADVISMLHTDDPLVMEIKVYDESKGYKHNRIISGFSQIVKYANDYHKNVGYLVVFVLDAVNFEIQGIEAEKGWPNRILFEGKTYYIVFINLNADVTGSKAGIIRKEVLTLSDLTTEAS